MAPESSWRDHQLKYAENTYKPMTFHMVTLFTLIFHSIIFRTQSLCTCDTTQIAYILLSGYTVTARESFLRIWSLCPWRGRYPSGPVTAIDKVRINMPSSGHISGNECWRVLWTRHLHCVTFFKPTFRVVNRKTLRDALAKVNTSYSWHI